MDKKYQEMQSIYEKMTDLKDDCIEAYGPDFVREFMIPALNKMDKIKDEYNAQFAEEYRPFNFADFVKICDEQGIKPKQN